MIDLLIALPLGFLYLISVLACGFYFGRHFSFLEENIFLRYGFSIACGLGVFGFLWGILATIPHAMQSLSVFILLCMFIFLGRQYLIAGFGDIKNILIDIKSIIWPDDKYLRWLSVPLVLYLLMALPLSFHPLGTDALAFYFAQSKLIAYAHHFVPLPGYESFAQIPLPAELNYTAVILMGSEWAARFITTFEFWACALLMAGCIYKLSNGNIRCTWLGIFLLFTSTGVTLLVSDGKTDLYGAMLGFAACYISLIAPLNARRNIVLLGMIVGLTFTAKLSYVPILVPMIGLIVFLRLWRENNFKKACYKSCVVGLIIALCIVAAFIPNVAKNFMAYGEPLAPFFFFHAHSFTPFLNQTWFSPEITRYILSIYPVAWTFGQLPLQHGNLSPYVWAALPALFLVKWKEISFITFVDKRYLLLAVAGVFGMVAWAVLNPSVVAPRYVFPALFAFIPIAAIGIDKLWDVVRTNRRAHKVFLGVIFLASFVVVINDLAIGKHVAKNILQGPQETQLRHVFAAAEAVKHDMPPDGRLFLAAWERALLMPQIMNCMLSFKEQQSLESIKNSLEYWKELYNIGTRIVLINVSARKDILAVLDPQKKPAWLKIEEKKLNDNYIMYVIVPKSDAPLPGWGCLETSRNYYQPKKLD